MKATGARADTVTLQSVASGFVWTPRALVRLELEQRLASDSDEVLVKPTLLAAASLLSTLKGRMV